MSEGWRSNVLSTEDAINEILRSARRIAVLGIKTEGQLGQPAFYVPEYLQNAGYEIVPVPVYYPDRTEILGEDVHRSIASIPERVDIVVVFRRSEDLPGHVDDLIEARPAAVWFQSGIRNDEVAERLAEAGIKVVQNRCTMTQHRLSLA